MFIKTTFNSDIKKYFSERTYNLNIFKKSKSQFYHLLGTGTCDWETPTGAYFPNKSNFTPPLYKSVNFHLAIKSYPDNIPLDCSFNFEGVTFRNSNTVSSNNEWLKTSDQGATQESIRTMLENSGILEDWDYYPRTWEGYGAQTGSNRGFVAIYIFSLVRKKPGDYSITSTGKKIESLLENIYTDQDVEVFQTPSYPDYIKEYFQYDSISSLARYENYFDLYNKSTFKYMIRESYSLSNDMSDNVSFYEIGLDVYTNSAPSEIGTLSKKLTKVADFNPMDIIDSQMTNKFSWKPTPSDLKLSYHTGGFLYNLQPWINYTTNGSNYVNKIKSSPYSIWSVKGYNQLFQNYIPNSNLSTKHNYIDDYYDQVPVVTYTSTGFDTGTVNVVIPSKFGGYWIGGSFRKYNGQPAVCMIKLKDDFTIDPTFTSHFNPGQLESVFDILELEDGRIICVGNFTSYDGSPIYGAVRLYPNGERDLTFAANGSAGYGQVNKIGRQSDGKIILIGLFTQWLGVSKNYLVRLEADGTIDNTFFSGGFNSTPICMKVLYDDKILIGGGFTTYNGYNSKSLVRLNSDGNYDSTYNVGLAFNGSVQTIETGSSYDDPYYIGGSFTQYNTVGIGGTQNVQAYKLICLSSGSPLAIFYDFHTKISDSGTPNFITSIKRTDSGLYIGGLFRNYDGIDVSNIVKVDYTGTLLDFDIDPGIGPDLSSVFGIQPIVEFVEYQLYPGGPTFSSYQERGGVIIGGNFTSYNGEEANRLVVRDQYGDNYVKYKSVPRSLLTNQPSVKRLNRDFEIVCSLSSKNTLPSYPDYVDISGVYSDGSTFSLVTVNGVEEYEYVTGNNINTLVFNPTTLLSGLTQSVKYVDVTFVLGVGDYTGGYYEEGPTQRYYVDGLTSYCDELSEPEEITPIVFLNAEGGYDCFEFNEISILKGDRKIDSYQRIPTYQDTYLSEFEKITNLEYNKTYTCVSRILDDEEFIWLEELGKSKKVYWYYGGELWPIIITGFEYISNVNEDKKISIIFKLSRPEVTY